MNKLTQLFTFLLLAVFIHVGNASAEEAIGIAAVVKGDVFVQNSLGAEKVSLKSQDKVYEKQIITTGKRARVQVIFNDDSVFTIGRNSEIILDEFVYDPATGDGKSLIEATKGVVKFVTGKIAKKDPKKVKVNTPFATIGVRGSGGIVQIQPDGQTIVGLTQCCLDVGPRNAPDMPAVPLDDLSTFTKVSDPTGPASQPAPMTPEMRATMNADLAGGFAGGDDPEGDGQKKDEEKSEKKKEEPKKVEKKKEENKKQAVKKAEKKEASVKKVEQKKQEAKKAERKEPVQQAKKVEKKQAVQQQPKKQNNQQHARKEPAGTQPAPKNKQEPQQQAVKQEPAGQQPPQQTASNSNAAGSAGTPPPTNTAGTPPPTNTAGTPPPTGTAGSTFANNPITVPITQDPAGAGTTNPPINTIGIASQSSQDSTHQEQQTNATITHTGFFKRFDVGGAVTEQGTTKAYISNDATKLITSFKEDSATDAGNPTALRAGAAGSVFTVPNSAETTLNDGTKFGGRGYQSASGFFFFYEFEDTTDASKRGMVVAAKDKVTPANEANYKASGVQHYQFFNDALKGNAGFFDYNQNENFKANNDPQAKAATGLSVDWDKKRFAGGKFSWGSDASAGGTQGYDIKVTHGEVNDSGSDPLLEGEVYQQTKYKDGANWKNQLSTGEVTSSDAYGDGSVVEGLFLETDADQFTRTATLLTDTGDINSSNLAVTDLNAQTAKLDRGPDGSNLVGFTAGFIERGSDTPKVFLNKGIEGKSSASGSGTLVNDHKNGTFRITKNTTSGTVKADIRVANVTGAPEQFATTIGGNIETSVLISDQHYVATELETSGAHQFDGGNSDLADLNTSDVEAVLASGSMADNNSTGVSQLCSTCQFTEWGVWAASFKEGNGGIQVDNTQSLAHLTPFIAGERTQKSVLDTLAGNNVVATYTGNVFGAIAKSGDQTYHTGDLTANANFNNRNVNVGITNFGGYDFSGNTGNNAFNAINNFAGTLSESGGAGTGSFNGAFFGPNAEEVGMNFEFNAADGAVGTGVGQAVQ